MLMVTVIDGIGRYATRELTVTKTSGGGGEKVLYTEPHVAFSLVVRDVGFVKRRSPVAINVHAVRAKRNSRPLNL